MAGQTDRRAAYLIIGAFVIGLIVLILWFALDFGGLAPNDDPVLPPEEPATVITD